MSNKKKEPIDKTTELRLRSQIRKLRDEMETMKERVRSLEQEHGMEYVRQRMEYRLNKEFPENNISVHPEDKCIRLDGKDVFMHNVFYTLADMRRVNDKRLNKEIFNIISSRLVEELKTMEEL